MLIKMLVMDVDGTLTDGRINMSETGELFKSYNIKDGYGIKHILPQHNIVPAIITARYSNSLKLRCGELNIQYLYQSRSNKMQTLQCLIEELNGANNTDYSLENVAYIGDDLLDLECMVPIKKAGGIVGCPADAALEVKCVSDFISSYNGGSGAVRDFIEHIISGNKEKAALINERISFAIDYIKSIVNDSLSLGEHVVNDYFYYTYQEYKTKKHEDCRFEAHRHYIDIQYILEGEELLEIDNVNALIPSSDYDEGKDVQFFSIPKLSSKVILKKGGYVILYPNNAHRPSMKVEESVKVRKIVGKVLMD